jgi:hypothetical protein
MKDSQREEPRVIVISSNENLDDFKRQNESLRLEHRSMQGNLMKGKSLAKAVELTPHHESRSILEQQPSISPLGPG